MKTASFYKKINSDNVRCLACNHYCIIHEGKKGLCGVRQNIGGRLYSLVYEKIAALHIDPIEKKPLYHFLPGSRVLSFGTVGCNFKCCYCQNWDISQISKPPFNQIFGDNINPKDMVKIAIKSGCPSIAYTYNEPAVFCEYMIDTMKLARKSGLKNIMVSNGYFSSEVRSKLVGLLDAANIDIKSFSEDFYRKICGATLKPVLENISALYNLGVHLELTTLIISGYNDSKSNIQKIADYIASVSTEIPWHISRFFPAYNMTHYAPTPVEKLEVAEKIGRRSGLKHIYMGNL